MWYDWFPGVTTTKSCATATAVAEHHERRPSGRVDRQPRDEAATWPPLLRRPRARSRRWRSGRARPSSTVSPGGTGRRRCVLRSSLTARSVLLIGRSGAPGSSRSTASSRELEFHEAEFQRGAVPGGRVPGGAVPGGGVPGGAVPGGAVPGGAVPRGAFHEALFQEAEFQEAFACAALFQEAASKQYRVPGRVPLDERAQAGVRVRRVVLVDRPGRPSTSPTPPAKPTDLSSGRAVSISAPLTWSGVKFGCRARMSAAVPDDDRGRERRARELHVAGRDDVLGPLGDERRVLGHRPRSCSGRAPRARAS